MISVFLLMPLCLFDYLKRLTWKEFAMTKKTGVILVAAIIAAIFLGQNRAVAQSTSSSSSISNIISHCLSTYIPWWSAGIIYNKKDYCTLSKNNFERILHSPLGYRVNWGGRTVTSMGITNFYKEADESDDDGIQLGSVDFLQLLGALLSDPSNSIKSAMVATIAVCNRSFSTESEYTVDGETYVWDEDGYEDHCNIRMVSGVSKANDNSRYLKEDHSYSLIFLSHPDDEHGFHVEMPTEGQFNDLVRVRLTCFSSGAVRNSGQTSVRDVFRAAKRVVEGRCP